VCLGLDDGEGAALRRKYVRNVASIDVPSEKDHVVSRAATPEVAGASDNQGSGRCRLGEPEDVEPVDQLAGIRWNSWVVDHLRGREMQPGE
jgi:hypothetical protein